ncbi:MAG: CsbD family protein [Actinobacteria bacterium]|nr:CsbD family protein [Actinomycetota bacterium]
MSANTDKAKGHVEQAIGSLTGDEDLEKEGRIDEHAGKVKDVTDGAIDIVRDKVKKVADRLTERKPGETDQDRAREEIS